MNSTDAPKIRKLELGVKKLRRSDIKWPNPCENQATHFVGYIQSPNVDNSSCNHKNVGTTFDAGFIICVSSTKEGKTQVGRALVVGRKVQR